MGSEGVGFAMPSNTIASVYNMLIGPEHKVTRGSIGISFQPGLNSAVGRVYGFSNGVLVSTVTPNGGAAKAGIQPGDVIVSIDGRNIKDGDDLVNDISARKVGTTRQTRLPPQRQRSRRERRHRRPRQDLCRSQRRCESTTTPHPQRSMPARASSASKSPPPLQP